MTKSTSIVLICVITALILVLGVFSLYPVEIQFGEYNNYNSPLALIQKGNGFTDSEKADYHIKLDEGADVNEVRNILKARLSKAYGYYDAQVTVEGDIVSVVIPKTATTNEETGVVTTGKTSATAILGNLAQRGKVEILAPDTSSYSKSSVVLGMEDFKSARVQTYASSGNTFYICEVKLNAEGRKKAESFTDGGRYGCALDEAVVSSSSYYVYYNSGKIQIYSYSTENCEVMASFINTSVIPADLTLDDTDTVKSNGGLIFAIVFAVIVLACFVFLLVRYKLLGLAGVISQLAAIVLFVVAAGLISFTEFGLVSAIGVVLAYAFMTAFTILSFEKIRSLATAKTFSSSRYTGFRAWDKISMIVHAAVLVLGIILWVIPTFITAPLGNVFVYGAVISFIVNIGLNRLFALIVNPLVEDGGSSKK